MATGAVFSLLVMEEADLMGEVSDFLSDQSNSKLTEDWGDEAEEGEWGREPVLLPLPPPTKKLLYWKELFIWLKKGSRKGGPVKGYCGGIIFGS